MYYDLVHQIGCAKHTFSGKCDITPMVCCSFVVHITLQFLQCRHTKRPFPAPWGHCQFKFRFSLQLVCKTVNELFLHKEHKEVCEYKIKCDLFLENVHMHR